MNKDSFVSKYNLSSLFKCNIYINTKDINSEANRNQVSLTLNVKDAQEIDKEILYDFIEEVINDKTKKAKKTSPNHIIFYLWYDPQSLQLSYSLVSDAKVLPFGCKIVIVSDYREIVNDFLDGCAKGFPNLNEFVDDWSTNELESHNKFELKVYLKKLI